MSGTLLQIAAGLFLSGAAFAAPSSSSGLPVVDLGYSLHQANFFNVRQ